MTDSLLEDNQLGLTPKGRGLVRLGSVWGRHPLHIPGREEAVAGVSVNGVGNVLVGVPGEQMYHPGGEMIHSLKGLINHRRINAVNILNVPSKMTKHCIFYICIIYVCFYKVCLQANIT